ncbi:protein O16 [Cercopithecine betaherpesvirus 5]|uniref:Protein O16 n=1 Tax=Simian cytomegalovirus (strain Colburn) TaxID=50292 RepID=G8XTK0_SCMVC|nr:protein O16 [Cercopithecine betaherpesvirus 5]AEV80492.1 protein O16 [Cercopithecine betaherpesvirus 5]
MGTQRASTIKMVFAVKSTCGRWRQGLRDALCCCLSRRSGPTTTDAAVQTDISYSTCAAKHTKINVYLDVSSFPAAKIGINRDVFSTRVKALLRDGVKSVLKGVMLTGQLQTTVNVRVVACGYPVTLVGVIDTENFSNRMADELQRVLQSLLELLYQEFPEHAKHEFSRKKTTESETKTGSSFSMTCN